MRTRGEIRSFVRVTGHYTAVGQPIVIAIDPRKHYSRMSLDELLGPIRIPRGAEFFSRDRMDGGQYEFYRSGRKISSKKPVLCIAVQFYKTAHSDEEQQFNMLQAELYNALQFTLSNPKPDVSDSDSDRYAAGISNAD